MSRRFTTALVVCCLPLASLFASWKADAQTDFDRRCYLRAQEILSRRLKDDPQNPEALEALDRLEEAVLGRLESAVLSFTERNYMEAYRHWREGRVREARNAWTKYLECRRREAPPMSDAQLKEVAEFHARAVRLAEPVVSGTPFGERASHRPRARRGGRRRIPRRLFPNEAPETLRPAVSPAKVAADMVAQAERARKNGQLERSAHLYRLARRLDPDSREIQEQLKKIEDELK